MAGNAMLNWQMIGRSERWRRWINVVMAASMLVVSIVVMKLQQYPDLLQDYAAAWGRLHGLDPNAATPTLLKACCAAIFPHGDGTTWPSQQAHPPFVTMLMLPLALFPWHVAQIIFLVLGWGAILVGWRTSRASFGVQSATAMWWIYGLAIGTFEPFVFCFLAAGIGLLDRTPRRAALCFGIATALKIYPGLLIVGLWLSGRRRVAIQAALVGVICFALGELAVGPGATLAWLAYLPINTQYSVDMLHNLSLVNLIRMIAPKVTPGVAALSVVLLLGLPLIRRVMQHQQWAAFTPVMLLASPLCWGQYVPLVTLVPASVASLALLGISGVTMLASILSIPLVPAGVPFAIAILVVPRVVLLLSWFEQFLIGTHVRHARPRLVLKDRRLNSAARKQAGSDHATRTSR